MAPPGWSRKEVNTGGGGLNLQELGGARRRGGEGGGGVVGPDGVSGGG